MNGTLSSKIVQMHCSFEQDCKVRSTDNREKALKKSGKSSLFEIKCLTKPKTSKIFSSSWLRCKLGIIDGI